MIQLNLIILETVVTDAAPTHKHSLAVSVQSTTPCDRYPAIDCKAAIGRIKTDTCRCSCRYRFNSAATVDKTTKNSQKQTKMASEEKTNIEMATSEIATGEKATGDITTGEKATGEKATGEIATSEIASSEIATSESLSREIVIREITDQSGKTMKMKDIGGRMYPNFPSESLNNVLTFKARPGDVLLCTHPKSGTHWATEIIRFLLAGTTRLPVVEKADSMIELANTSTIEELPSPRNINTHFHFKSLSPEFFRHKCKMVYMTRNPRDAVVSYFRHVKILQHAYNYDGEWKDFFQLYLEGKMEYGSWFEYTKGWEKGMRDNPQHPFLVLSYEAMKEQPLKQMKRIDEFLGTHHSDDVLEDIVDKTSFKVMKEERVSKGTKYAGLFRKGEVGDWKNWFTVTQMETFNELFEREMAGTEAYSLYSHTVCS